MLDQKKSSKNDMHAEHVEVLGFEFQAVHGGRLRIGWGFQDFCASD